MPAFPLFASFLAIKSLRNPGVPAPYQYVSCIEPFFFKSNLNVRYRASAIENQRKGAWFEDAKNGLSPILTPLFIGDYILAITTIPVVVSYTTCKPTAIGNVLD